MYCSRPWPETEVIEFSETCLEKLVRSHGMNLFSAGFSLLKPLCVRPSAVRALQQPLFLWSQMNNWTQSSSTPCLAYYMAFWPSPTSCLFCTDQRSTEAKISSFGQNEGSWNHNTGFNIIWSVNTYCDKYRHSSVYTVNVGTRKKMWKAKTAYIKVT